MMKSSGARLLTAAWHVGISMPKPKPLKTPAARKWLGPGASPSNDMPAAVNMRPERTSETKYPLSKSLPRKSLEKKMDAEKHRKNAVTLEKPLCPA